MQIKSNKLLIIAAFLSAIAGCLHLACIVFGAPWYRALGAGEELAVLAEQGHWYPTAVTLLIAVILFVWTLYALAAAGVTRVLPLQKTALVLISLVLLVRGVSFVFLMPYFVGNSITFWLVSSTICLTMGLLFGIGTYQVWPQLTAQSKT